MRGLASTVGILCFTIGCVMLVAPRAALADDPPETKQIVFLGLLPLTDAHGTGDLVGLKVAQGTRIVVEKALAELSHAPVFGHLALSDRLGKGYLPKWFYCRGDVTCLFGIVGPLSAAGLRIALTGDYFIKDATYHVHVVSFSLADGRVSKEVTFELAAADITDQAHWLEQLKPLLASPGRIKIASNVGGVTCTIDGQPCGFEPDGQTVAVASGAHTIELSKDDYQPEKLVVTVATGTTQEVAIALKRTTEGQKPGAATGPRRAPTLNAVRTEKPLEIDGKLDELAWQKAWIETNFTQNFPHEAQAPTERTELRVLYDDDAIYLGIRCYDSDPAKIVSRLTRRDRDIGGDKVTVDISSKNDHSTSYTFQVSAANVQVDGTRFNDTGASTDLDAVWYSATSRDDKGWVAELAIPLAALRYSGDTTSFGFQVRRHIERLQEIDEWSYVPRDAQGEVSYYGTLEALTNLHAKRLAQITPYDSRRATLRRKQGALDGTAQGGNVGADLKIGLTPALTLDGTVNPDFGTVEVDQVVVNLSSVEIFFPEKRPFFLEGADLFTMPFGLFYSRRVGKTPPSTSVDGDAAAAPPDGQILAAGKVTGFLAGRTSIGVLDAVTAREDATIIRPGAAAPENVLVEPLTNFAVLRLKQDFGLNSSLGVMATSVNRAEPFGAAPMAGDRCPQPHFGIIPKTMPVGGRCTNDAYTGGVDTVLRTGDGTWGASGQLVGSILEKGPPRFVLDGTQINPGDLGWGTIGNIGKYGGEHLLYELQYSYMTPKLEINDAGFNPSANELTANAFVTLRSTKRALGLLNTNLRLNLQYQSFADTHAITNTGVNIGSGFSGVFMNWSGTLPNFWTFRINGGPIVAGYNNRETRDGALQRIPAKYRFSTEWGTDPRKAIVAGLVIDGFKTQRGLTVATTFTLGFRLLSFVELDVISDGFWSNGTPRYVDQQTNPDMSRTYLFQDLDSRAWDVLLRGTLTLSPTLSFQTYAQIFLEAGHFGDATSATGSGMNARLDNFTTTAAPAGTSGDYRHSNIDVNAFLRWQYRPGSAFWVVYTRHQEQVPFEPDMEGAGRLRFDKLGGPSTDVILLKLSYMWEPLQHH